MRSGRSTRRWPLSLGVRSSITLPYRGTPDSFTLSLFAARPGVMDTAQIPLAELLVAFGGAALAAVSRLRRGPAHSGPTA